MSPDDLDRLGVGRLLGRQRGVEQQVGHAEDAVERRANLVRHHGEEAGLGEVGRLGLVAGASRAPARPSARSVTSRPTLCVSVRAEPELRTGDLAPCDPARAAGGIDLLIMDAGAVRGDDELALLQDLRCVAHADDLGAGSADERTERVIRIGDAVVVVPADDDISLGLEETARAFLGLLELECPVGQFLDAFLEAPVLGRELPVAPRQERQHAAGGSNQRAADGGPDGSRNACRIGCRTFRHEIAEHDPEGEQGDRDAHQDGGGRMMEQGARPHLAHSVAICPHLLPDMPIALTTRAIPIDRGFLARSLVRRSLQIPSWKGLGAEDSAGMVDRETMRSVECDRPGLSGNHRAARRPGVTIVANSAAASSTENEADRT